MIKCSLILSHDLVSDTKNMPDVVNNNCKAATGILLEYTSAGHWWLTPIIPAT
jgi:hypothetical protein